MQDLEVHRVAEIQVAFYWLDYIAISAAVPWNPSLFITGKHKIEFSQYSSILKMAYFHHMASNPFLCFALAELHLHENCAAN